MQRDQARDIKVVQSLAPAVRAASANGAVVDTRGYNSATVLVESGAIVTAGNQTPKLQHGDLADGSDATDVAAADLLGAFVSPIVADSVQKVGYRGGKRYIRPVITHNSGTSVATASNVVLGNPDIRPVE